MLETFLHFDLIWTKLKVDFFARKLGEGARDGRIIANKNAHESCCSQKHAYFREGFTWSPLCDLGDFIGIGMSTIVGAQVSNDDGFWNT